MTSGVLIGFLITFGLTAASDQAQAGKSSVPKLGQASIPDVIAAMTLEEKASLVVGTGMRRAGPPPGAGLSAPANSQTKAASAKAKPPAPPQEAPSLVPGAAGTTFAYGNLKLSSENFSGPLIATVEVKNTGTVTGKEAAQLYLSAPARKLDKPALELKGFAKTKLLAPGESQTLTFVLNGKALASFDPGSSTWTAEAGRYEVKVGASSRDIRQTASFTLPEDLVVKKAYAGSDRF